MKKIPLAERIRPKDLKSFIGQEHLLGVNAFLYKQLKSGYLSSLIFWGPPGTGKTTLANILAKETGKPFYKLSAINSGVKDIRNILEKVNHNSGLFSTATPILFIDEIHRFNKSQQDSLLEAVEKGQIILIGATTENPSFEINNALLSRCQVLILKTLSKTDLDKILKQAIATDSRLQSKNIILQETDALFRLSGGDARKLLNIFEQSVLATDENPLVITNKLVESSIKNVAFLYDKKGEMHYDIVSAFIKSIRGSDPNAAIYWLARMIEGGEDPLFIARRLIISASEDIGLANPNALLIANAAFDAVSKIGFPEARITLAQAVIYLASSPKSNSVYMAINQAQAIVKQTGNLPVPLSLRNAPTSLMKESGYGKDYQYAHNFEGNFVYMDFMPEEISHKNFYEPGDNPSEKRIREKLKSQWQNKYKY